MDENLFGQLINMAQMEQAYDTIAMEVASANITAETFARFQTMNEQEQFVENLVHMYGLFFQALRQQLIQKEKHCLNHEAANTPGGVTPMFDQKDNKQHESTYKNLLQWPYPEVYNFNLGWGIEPKHTSILKTLTAIPEHFNLQDVYNSSKQGGCNYVIRGMICFSEGGHYLSFFRRILIKVEHLVSINCENIRQEC